MSLKSELITWGAALKAYDKQEYEEALEVFSASLPSVLYSHSPSHLYSPLDYRGFLKDTNQYGSHPCNSRRA